MKIDRLANAYLLPEDRSDSYKHVRTEQLEIALHVIDALGPYEKDRALSEHVTFAKEVIARYCQERRIADE